MGSWAASLCSADAEKKGDRGKRGFTEALAEWQVACVSANERSPSSVSARENAGVRKAATRMSDHFLEFSISCLPFKGGDEAPAERWPAGRKRHQSAIAYERMCEAARAICEQRARRPDGCFWEPRRTRHPYSWCAPGLQRLIVCFYARPQVASGHRSWAASP